MKAGRGKWLSGIFFLGAVLIVCAVFYIRRRKPNFEADFIQKFDKEKIKRVEVFKRHAD